MKYVRVLGVLVLVSFVLAIWSLHSARQNTITYRQQLCETVKSSNKALAAVLLYGRERARDKRLTPQQHVDAETFYNHSLGLIKSPPCGRP